MHIVFAINGFADLSLRNYDPVEDDVRSILQDICQAIDGVAEFNVGGFGQERWPVDIKTDLPVFLEQLPQAINATLIGNAMEISFYEQGVERTIEFEPLGRGYRATCLSWAKWQPQPAIEYVSSDGLRNMLLRIQDEFLMVVEEVEPALMRCDWVKRWLSGVR
ncbi:hypothetical protein [Delftia sp. CH05]|uniref:hypothetical protein n=1 Tax=Delftia sp. CH05 TaxID=2692194 RepID=UPI00135E53AD|nr:hypothetical protein [Delftia sp. CH05]MXN27331.1 hypothetical protein [Delftia sp. CH05]